MRRKEGTGMNMGFVDYYDVLQVSPRADAEVIEKAYRVLIGKHHPDKGGDTRIAQRLNEAHAVLGDPSKRVDYNREWARHRNRTVRPSGNAASQGAEVPQGAPSGRRRPPLAASWVVGLLLVLLGVAFMATGSAFVGLVLAVAGMMFIFNLWGLWLLVGLLTLGAGIVVRYGLRVRRQTRVART
jgi:hypothetical protein